MTQRKKNRILCLHTGDNILRGSEHALIEILQGFKKAGRVVCLLCDQPTMFEAAKHLASYTHQITTGEFMLDAPEYKLTFSRLIRGNVTVLRYLKAFKPDVIYCSGGRSCQNSLLAAKLVPTSIVVHLHAPYAKKYLLFYGIPWATAVIHCSRYIQHYHEKQVKLRRSLAVVNGIDFDALHENFSDEPRMTPLNSASSKDKVALGFIGSLIPRKGIDVLIDAMAILIDKNIAVSLFIAGKEYSPIYRERAQRMNLLDHIHFIGEVSNRQKFFSTIDLHVLPSRSEAFGRTIVEAASFGVPSVAHAVGGIPEAIANGKFGLVYSPNNAATLARTIAIAIDNKTTHFNSSELKQLSQKQFTISKTVEEILSCLDSF